ncbi:class I SAM-dependent methyltransferase [Atopomonas sediminilitoris]|uniref:class I SAM-dependent methyltransferase n=1 Tax=Atopomonas sediminilitoris TaxID=2919919 RepID=UPI003520E265
MPATSRRESAHISPSAHYTGFVWFRHGLSEAPFASDFGRFAHRVLRPVTWGARRFFGLDIERFLLQRHLLIDARLEQTIARDGVTQVVEIACGLSPRGRRMRKQYPQLTYVEADLPEMASSKRELLRVQGWLGPRHRVEAVDILADSGELSLSALFAGLDRSKPVVVITEGLLNYFERPVVERFWRALAQQLQAFPAATYLTELYPDLTEHPRYRQLRWGVWLIGKLTRGGYPLHYQTEAAIAEAGKTCGFRAVQVLNPDQQPAALGLPRGPLASLVRIVEARC